MLRSLTESIRSFWSNSTDTLDRVPTGSKRKSNVTECFQNDDPDVQILRVEKRRKLDNHTPGFTGLVRDSVTRMADWIGRKPKAYSDDFKTRPSHPAAHDGWTAFPQENGGHRGMNPVSKMNGEGNGNHMVDPHQSVFKFNAQSSRNGPNLQERKVQENSSFTRRTSESSSYFGYRKRSKANESVRLREKQQYQQLLQLQNQRSPWQTKIPMCIPGVSSSFDAPVGSGPRDSPEATHAAPESGSERRLKSCIEVAEMLKVSAISSLLSKQRRGSELFMPMPPPSSASNLKTALSQQSSYATAVQVKPQQQLQQLHPPSAVTVTSGGGPLLSRAALKQRRTISSRGDQCVKEGEDKNLDLVVIENRDSGCTEALNQAGRLLEETIVIDDEEDEKVERRVLPEREERTVPHAKQSFNGVEDRFALETKMSQAYSKRCQAHIQEKERRKREIEEEEMKAKAYEEKRRAQNLSLERQMKYQMKIFDELPEVTEGIFIEDEEEEIEETLPELNDEMMDVIRTALRPGNPNDVLSDAFRLQITRRDMSTLAGLNWLNDEVINFYMNMLMERGEHESRAKTYAFNTFFYPKIMSGGHSAVKRWTKKVDIFAVHFILIPVHLGVHWCLCVADMHKKVITYYDSMGATNNKCLQAVLNYINDESVAKKQTPINKSEWSLINAEDNPQQMNGSDCGMFMCKYAEYITRQKEITFTQEDMPYFRQRMVYEIISKKLLQ